MFRVICGRRKSDEMARGKQTAPGTDRLQQGNSAGHMSESRVT